MNIKHNIPIILAGCMAVGIAVLLYPSMKRLSETYGLLFAGLIGINTAAFLIYWIDKRRAQKNAWRVPEAVLFTIAAIGGWPASIAAQAIFRHKTRKLSFKLVFWAIVGIEIAVLAGIVFNRG